MVSTAEVPALRRVALVSDVHGNVPALAATLAEIESADVDAVAFLGCLTWGPGPLQVLEMAWSVPVPTFFVRGNGERAALELADGTRRPERAVDAWMVAAHGRSGIEAIRAFQPVIVLEVGGLGPVWLCHGSPRSDIELLTPVTPEGRLRQAFDGVTGSVVAHGHTHLQYERNAAGKRVVGAGSVGLPYGDGPSGARWAVLGPDVELRVTPYDLALAAQAAQAARSQGYPADAAERYLQTLRRPPSQAELEADAESREFSD
jgi:predicted phosphodiesterase